MIYLASQSPRRQQLLEQIGVPFTRLSGCIDEIPGKGEPAREYVMRMAMEKARDGWSRVEQQNQEALPVLAADTTVVVDNRILGKPVDNAHAYDMLINLRGRRHQVMSAISVTNGQRIESVISISYVEMAAYSDEQIKSYIATGEPEDKAGSYAIQGLGAVLVKRIEGSYSGVMGLPLHETVELLKGFDIACWQGKAVAGRLPD